MVILSKILRISLLPPPPHNLPMVVFFFSFPTYIALSRTITTMLNRNSWCAQSCPILLLRENILNLLPLSMRLAAVTWRWSVSCGGNVLGFLGCWDFLPWKSWLFSKIGLLYCFVFPSLRWLHGSSSMFDNVVNYIE